MKTSKTAAQPVPRASTPIPPTENAELAIRAAPHAPLPQNTDAKAALVPMSCKADPANPPATPNTIITVVFVKNAIPNVASAQRALISAKNVIIDITTTIKPVFLNPISQTAFMEAETVESKSKNKFC